MEISTDYKLQQQLQSKLRKARLYLDDAENRQLGNEDIKEWLDDLKHLLFQADDLSEEIRDSQNRKSLIKPLKPIYQSLDGTVRGELEEILMELDGLLDRVSDLGLKHCDASTARGEGSSSTANPAPLLAKNRVFGRNHDKDEILELLLSDKAFGNPQNNVGTETGELSQNKIGVVPIVGMGGIGKTTLAQLVYHDTRVEPEFQLRAWVTVSTDFDICKILMSLLEQINPGAVGTGTGELSLLQEKMKDALTGKKFLIVLDDVWDESYSKWNLLKSNFEWGVLGSRVVVTTRIGKVGDMVKTGPIHMLRGVSREDCWSIFINHAFSGGNSDSFPRLHEIGRKIVEKCDGLPLAVMAMGGLLCSTRDLKAWENVLNSHVWECGENNQGHGVLPSLWLSYRYLPSSVKQCFAYCSMFPQDYEFDKKQMVLLWMAEGFLPCGKTETPSMEELGEQYFDNLVSRSLFQRSSKDESQFIMHDLIHDLAAIVSDDFCVSVTKEGMELERVSIRTRHLSHSYAALDSNVLSSVSKAKHLRSFLSQWKYWGFHYDEFVKQLSTNHRRLRALSIRARDPISASFINLKHLRFLKLYTCKFKEVPSSVCTLFNLQTLILSGCDKLTQLPTDIKKLIKLRHLDYSGSELIKHMPPHMGNLKELRTLSHFIVGDPNVSTCSNINELQEFQHLSGTLRVSGLENAAKFQDVGKDILGHKANLKELVLKWAGTSISRREDEEVLDALQPHTNLERLVIEGYQALSFPTWVHERSYDKLVSVEVHGRFCKSLPPFWQLPSLLKLVIKSFEELEKIGLEFHGNDSSTSPFQCLETLELHWMRRLKECVFVDKAVPLLKNLTLSGCPDLPVSSINCNMVEEFKIWGSSSLECFPLDKFPMLRKLSLEACTNLKAVTNDGNSESLTSLKLKGCPEMESFPAAGLPKGLTHLEIWRCSKLISAIRGGLQNLTALVLLSIRSCTCESTATAASMSSELFAQVLLPNSLAYLKLRDLGGYKSINGSAFQQATSLKILEIIECNELESLPEEELPSSLSSLEIFECRLLERKYHKSKGDESYQHISHIPIINIQGDTTDELDGEE